MSQSQVSPETKATIKKSFKPNSIRNRGMRLVLRTVLWCVAGQTSQEQQNLNGLLQDSMIGNPLSRPSDDGTDVTFDREVGGRYYSYDFWRPQIFPATKNENPIRQVSNGRLAAFIIDEVRDRDPDQLTELGTFNFYDLTHLVELSTYGVEELTDAGLIRMVTHGEAYRSVGLYDTYAESLERRRVIDDPVFQITPKGNTLVFLSRDSGEQKPKESKVPEHGWLPAGLRPV